MGGFRQHNSKGERCSLRPPTPPLVATQELQTIRANSLQENAGCNRQPEYTDASRERSEKRKRPCDERASVVHPIVLNEQERCKEDRVYDDNHTAAEVDTVKVRRRVLLVLASTGDQLHTG